ncbi:MAG: DivIVA domain-containing protein [Myxococcota bacterium]
MRMTPLDVQSHSFARRWRGYDADEVDAFLRIVAEDYEGLVRENATQADRLYRLERRIEELSAQEQLLKQTLLSAQSMCEELRRSAERDAELRLAEVEVRAEKILDASHRRAAQLAQDIREMRVLRTRLGESIRSAAETHIALLATLEADPAEDPLVKGLAEGTVAYLKADRRRPAADAPSSSAHPGQPDSLAGPGRPPAGATEVGAVHPDLGKDSRRG